MTADTNCDAPVADTPETFRAYLNDPATVFGEDTSRVMNALCDRDSLVSRTNSRNYEERLDPLKAAFVRKVLVRGLYAAIDDSRSTILTSADPKGPYIGTFMCAGRLMMTLSQGKEGSAKYNQITFICEDDKPSRLSINSMYGTYAQLEKLIEKAGNVFKDPVAGYKAMQPDSVGFAGVSLGTPRKAKGAPAV